MEPTVILGNRACKCGAIYRRTEAVIEARQIDGFECVICGGTLESWNSTYVHDLPYVGPIRSPDQSRTGALSL